MQMFSPVTVRDDRILPVVKAVGAFIVLVLLVAFAILYFMADRLGTEDLFSWRIKPTMTPLLMGAGYISGAWFFARLVMEKKWHRVGWGFWAITAFVWFMGLSTFLHFDKFGPLSNPSFWAWTILYVVTPLLVPFLWWINHGADPGTPDPDDLVVPAWVRQLALVAGGGMAIIAVLTFIFADWVADQSAAAPNGLGLWAWTTTPLTARVLAGWFALPGVVGLVLSREPRWSSWRILIEAQIIALALMVVGILRAWNEFHFDRPFAWVFVLGIVGLLVGAAALYGSMEMRRRRVAMTAPA